MHSPLPLAKKGYGHSLSLDPDLFLPLLVLQLVQLNLPIKALEATAELVNDVLEVVIFPLEIYVRRVAAEEMCVRKRE